MTRPSKSKATSSDLVGEANVARVYKSISAAKTNRGCGYNMKFCELVEGILDNASGPVQFKAACLVCSKPIGFIDRAPSNGNEHTNSNGFVLFKFGKLSYWLSLSNKGHSRSSIICSSSSRLLGFSSNRAQLRISMLLGLCPQGLKVCDHCFFASKRVCTQRQTNPATIGCYAAFMLMGRLCRVPTTVCQTDPPKGQNCFPNKTVLDQDILATLVSVSRTDWVNRKASLLIMGTRLGKEMPKKCSESQWFNSVLMLSIAVVIVSVTAGWYFRNW